MSMEKRLQSHYESLSRAIGFTRASDTKVGPVLALQVALAGTLAARMEGLWEILTRSSASAEAVAVGVVLGIYATLLAASIFLSAIVYVPRNPRTGESLIYFEDIAALSVAEFSERSKGMNAEEIERQLLQQVHAVSRVASAKMKWAALGLHRRRPVGGAVGCPIGLGEHLTRWNLEYKGTSLASE